MRRSLALLLVTSCATAQMNAIEQARGPRLPIRWTSERIGELVRRATAGEVLPVDDEDVLLDGCTAMGRYHTTPTETELVEVESPILPCNATRVITGFTLTEGVLTSISVAPLADLATATTMDRGELEGEWTLRSMDGAELCKLPCKRYFLPEVWHRAGYVERDQERAEVPWDPLAPGSEVELSLKRERHLGEWPAIPIVLAVVGLAGAAASAVVLAKGDLGGDATSPAGRAGHTLGALVALPLLGLVSLGLGIGGVYWLATPPEPAPRFVRD